MAAGDVCVVGYRKGDPRLKDARALGVLPHAAFANGNDLRHEQAPRIAAAYATAATGIEMSRLSRAPGRPRRQAWMTETAAICARPLKSLRYQRQGKPRTKADSKADAWMPEIVRIRVRRADA